MDRRRKPKAAKARAKRPRVRKAPKGAGTEIRDLETRLAASLEREKETGALLQENTRALTETLKQQTATAEILRVISASPSDVEPVFQAIARSATRICDAKFGTVFRFDGERFTVGAHHD